MEKNHKNPKSWSELPRDLVISVFERLGFADFKRAISVCSSWLSASRRFVPTNQVPWLILFPKDINNALTLFNPEEKDKLYKTQSLGVEFAKSCCWGTYGSWLLMKDSRRNLSIVNTFTQERINLPPMESQLGVTKVERTVDRFVIFDQVSSRYRNICIRSTVFWIDEETKEYIALCALGQWCVVYSKKGDTFWNQVPEISDCECMLYKNHKLYCISKSNIFTILDFSGQIPQQTFQCSMLPTTLSGPWYVLSKRFVVTITGDVVMVEKVKSFKNLTSSHFASSRFIHHHQDSLRNMKELSLWAMRQWFWMHASLYSPIKLKDSKEILYISVVVVPWKTMKSLSSILAQSRWRNSTYLILIVH